MIYAIVNPEKEQELLEAAGKFYAVNGVDDSFTLSELKDLFFPEDVVWISDLDEAFELAEKIKDEERNVIFLWGTDALNDEFDIFTNYVIINSWEDYIMTLKALG